LLQDSQQNGVPLRQSSGSTLRTFSTTGLPSPARARTQMPAAEKSAKTKSSVSPAAATPSSTSNHALSGRAPDKRSPLLPRQDKCGATRTSNARRPAGPQAVAYENASPVR